jgi:hypothetical protein
MAGCIQEIHDACSCTRMQPHSYEREELEIDGNGSPEGIGALAHHLVMMLGGLEFRF